jgi:molecular chaperone GrpE (heat shock protein)
MSQAIEIETDFTTVMQELSAQAATPPPPASAELVPVSGISALISAIHSLGQRVEALEESVVRNFESIHFQKIEDQLSAIRESETVNQKLFDSLHEELISYRDNFVRDSLQKPFIRDLLVLFDDLSTLAGQFEETANEDESHPENARSRNNLTNMLHFLLEILHRLEVNEMAVSESVDRTLHRVISFEPAECAEEDGRIVKRLKRGFTWHDRVLRAEEVIAKRFQ